MGSGRACPAGGIHKQNRRFWLAAIAAVQNLRLPQRCGAVILLFFLCLLDGVRFKNSESDSASLLHTYFFLGAVKYFSQKGLQGLV